MHVPAADVKAVPGYAVVSGSADIGLSGSGMSGSSYSSFEISRRGPSGLGLGGFGLGGVVEPAEEQGGVRDVFQRFGPVVQVGLEVFLGDRVPAHGLE